MVHAATILSQIDQSWRYPQKDFPKISSGRLWCSRWSCRLELAVVMRESTRTEEAVGEWWDMAPLADDADSGRTLLVALMEELRPALLLAKVFVRV